MILRVTPQARHHLDGIARYLSERNPAAASRVRTDIHRAFKLLAHFPRRGRAGALRGTREILVASRPYIVVYRIEADNVVILGVYYGAQLRPGQDTPSDL